MNIFHTFGRQRHRGAAAFSVKPRYYRHGFPPLSVRRHPAAKKRYLPKFFDWVCKDSFIGSDEERGNTVVLVPSFDRSEPGFVRKTALHQPTVVYPLRRRLTGTGSRQRGRKHRKDVPTGELALIKRWT